MNKPKGVSESFDHYLSRVKQKASDPSQPSAAKPSQSRAPAKHKSEASVSAQVDLTASELKIFSAKTQTLLSNFSGLEQKKILKFWYEMTLNFGQGKVRQEFGDEPDRHLMIFAASLDESGYRRLTDNLEERLKKGREWPPSFAVFKALKDTPTDREILEARTNILTLKKPLSRVETYISQRKSAKLKSLSERYMAEDFRTLYLEAFEEVILYNQDQTLNERENVVQNAMDNIKKTPTDQRIDELVASKYKLPGKLGEMVESIHQLRQHRVNIKEEKS